MSLWLFDNTVKCVYSSKAIKEVESLTDKVYKPCGGTALFDAIGEILMLPTFCAKVVVILTDGHENSSNHYTLKSVKDLIELHTSRGVEILYLGANQDAFEEADKLGIRRDNAMNFETDSINSAFDSMGACVRRRSTGDSATPMK